MRIWGGHHWSKCWHSKPPSLGEIVVFGSKRLVCRDPRKQNFSQGGQQGFFLDWRRNQIISCLSTQKSMVVVTQHVNNIETLDTTQNEQVQKLYLQDNSGLAEDKFARKMTTMAIYQDRQRRRRRVVRRKKQSRRNMLSGHERKRVWQGLRADKIPAHDNFRPITGRRWCCQSSHFC